MTSAFVGFGLLEYRTGNNGLGMAWLGRTVLGQGPALIYDGGFCSFAGLLVAFVVVWENVRFIMTVPSVFVFMDVTERQGKSSWTDSPTLLV